MSLPACALSATHFGEHLIIDGYRCDSHLLSDRNRVLNSIAELAQLIGLRQLSSADIRSSSSEVIPGASGTAGFALIDEGHISVHAFPEAGLLNVDIFTCRIALDTQRIVDWFTELFGIKVVDVNVLRRGLKFPVHGQG